MTDRTAASIVSRLGPFLDAAPDAMLVVQNTGHILAANVHAVRLFGYDRDELTGRTIELLVPGRLHDIHLAHRRDYLADPHPRDMGAGLDLYARRKDGSEFPVEISLSPVKADDISEGLVIAAIRDATIRRRIEAKFRGLLEAAPDAMVVSDRQGQIVLINGQAQRLFGYNREELLGREIELLVPARHAAVHPQHRRDYVQDPHVREMGAGLELHARRKDGSEFPVEISLSPLETEDGMLVTSAVRDITERKRLEHSVLLQNQELEAQNRRVQEASRMKSEFLANMSHELRTPLNSIIGFAELMHDGKLGAIASDHREYLGDILTSARHLLQLINDVLDLSKVESGKMEFFPEPVRVATLIDEMRDLVRSLAAGKRIRLETTVDPALREVIIDPAKLKQVLYNYLSNALKFSQEDGRVIVRAMRERDGWFRLEVEDNGIGIREEDLPRLFIEFQQLDAGTSKKYAGTGLGLALTKRMVEAQGGEVGVQSTYGKGSLFYAIFPQAPLPLANGPVAPDDRDSHSAPVVLVLDDDAASLRLLETALRQLGYRAVCAPEAQQAIDIVRSDPPDLLIVDLLMPTMAGLEFVERVRATRNGASIPILIWTVKEIPPDERASLLSLTQGIVQKKEGGVSRLLEQLRQLLKPLVSRRSTLA